MPPTPAAAATAGAPEQTDRAKRLQERRDQRAQQELPEGRSEGAPKTTVSLSIMLGEGLTVEIGAKSYEVAAFPIMRLAAAGKLLQRCPDLLVTAALSAEDGSVDTAQITSALNRLVAMTGNKDADVITEEVITYSLSALALNVTEDEAEAMSELTALALRRRHPDIQAETLADDLDIETFLRVLCKVYDVNRAMKARFLKPEVLPG